MLKPLVGGMFIAVLLSACAASPTQQRALSTELQKAEARYQLLNEAPCPEVCTSYLLVDTTSGVTWVVNAVDSSEDGDFGNFLASNTPANVSGTVTSVVPGVDSVTFQGTLNSPQSGTFTVVLFSNSEYSLLIDFSDSTVTDFSVPRTTGNTADTAVVPGSCALSQE